MHKKFILIILALTLLAFANSLLNGFVGDDNFVIVSNDFYRSWDNFPRLFTSEYITDSDSVFNQNQDLHTGSVAYRPVLSATFFLDYAVWNLNPFGYHLTNLILHLLNSLLVYFVVFGVLKNQSAAFFAALLFGVHPLKSEAVASIGYRADPLSCSFVLLSFFCYLIHKNHSPVQSLAALFLSMAFFFLAVFTKESAVILPALIFCYDWFFSDKKEKFKKKLITYTAYIGITLFYLFIYFKIFPNSTLGTSQLIGGGVIVHAISMLRIFYLYLLAFLFPFLVQTLPPLYKPPIEFAWESETWLSVSAVFLFIMLFIKIFRWKKEAAFFLLWFLISFIPVSNIIPIVNPMAYRFMYLPSVGILTVMAMIFVRGLPFLPALKEHVRLAKILQAGFISLCMITTMILNMAWHDNFVMAAKMIDDYPREPIGYLHLATEYFKSGRVREAKELLEKGLSLGLSDPRAYYTLGLCTLFNLEESKSYNEQNIQMFPNFALSYTGVGRVYFLQKDYEKALPYLEKSIELAPKYSTYGYLIQIYLIQERKSEAQFLLKQARAILREEEHLKSLARFFEEEQKVKFPIDIGL